MPKFFYFLFAVVFVMSCKTGKEAFDPEKKYPAQQLQQDYQLFRHILEESHPSLYWYTTKDSLDYYFNKGYSCINDSMTLPQFRTLLSYAISKINCGHTSMRYSKAYLNYLDTAKIKLFPLGLKFWADTMVVTLNINRRDSILKRGVVVKSINGHLQSELRDTLFNYIVTDGYSQTGKYQSLSTDFTLGNWYKNVFGLTDSLQIVYLDSAGAEKAVMTPLYDPRADTFHVRKNEIVSIPKFTKKTKPPKKLKLLFYRTLEIDTNSNTAYMTVNTFSRGYHLKKFFRHSFKTLDEKHIQNLIVDVRSNGGGETTNSTLLTKFIINKKFKLADSLYTVNRSSKYDKYIDKSFLYRMLIFFATKKHADGKYHFGYFERHYFKPKEKDHFNGNVYVLIGGNSFSATTLFAGAVKGQKNVTLIGEETGGGYYGNTAWMIPDVTLPNTKLRFRLPKFRLVVDKNREKNGHGVMPDVFVPPTALAIKNGIDFKTAKAKELIRSSTVQNP